MAISRRDVNIIFRGIDEVTPTAQRVQGSIAGVGTQAETMSTRSAASFGMLGFALVSVGAAAAKAAWDLGAFALEQDAMARGGENARTSIDRLDATMSRLKLTVGRGVAPAVNETTNLLTILIGKLSGTSEEADILQARYETLSLRQDRLNALIAEGGVLTASYQDRLAAVRKELNLISIALLQVNQMDWNLGAVTMGLARMSAGFQPGMDFQVNPTGWWRSMMQTWDINTIDQVNRKQEARLRSEQSIANKVAQVWKQALEQSIATVQGVVGGMIGNVKGLLGGTGIRTDMFAPGGTGPFESIFRMLDIAKLGGKSPWTAALPGIGQGAAQRMAFELSQGWVLPGAQALIDENQLIAYLKFDAQAKAVTEAWIKKIAEKAGLPSYNVAKILMQGGDDMTGLSKINVATDDMVGSAINYLTSDAGKVKVNQLGSTMADGWIAGLENRTGDLIAAVESIVGKMLSAASNAASAAVGAGVGVNAALRQSGAK